MKFKKMLAVLLTSVLLLSFSSSANAALGIADTKSTALGLLPSQAFKLFLDADPADKDWFMWTNNTGEDKLVSGLTVLNNASRKDFRLGFMIDYGNNKVTSLAYTDTSYGGNAMSLDYLYLKPGSTVYFVVEHAPGKNLLAQYDFVIFVSNI